MNESVLYIPRPKLSIHTQSTSRDQSENGFLLKVWALFVDQPSRPPAVARNPPRLEKTKIRTYIKLINAKNASLGVRSPCQSTFMFGQHNTLTARMLFSKKDIFQQLPRTYI